MKRRIHSIRRKGLVLSVFLPLLALVTSAAAVPVHMGNFACDTEALPDPWQLVQLDQRVPATRYRALRWDGRASVEATANASMALLARPLAIDLQATPVLCLSLIHISEPTRPY